MLSSPIRSPRTSREALLVTMLHLPVLTHSLIWSSIGTANNSRVSPIQLKKWGKYNVRSRSENIRKPGMNVFTNILDRQGLRSLR